MDKGFFDQGVSHLQEPLGKTKTAHSYGSNDDAKHGLSVNSKDDELTGDSVHDALEAEHGEQNVLRNADGEGDLEW